MTTKVKRVLPADVYDALELSAVAYGGIGGLRARDSRGNPCCLLGHIDNLVTDPYGTDGQLVELRAAIRRAQDGIPWLAGRNDLAVKQINLRNGVVNEYARVSFAEYVAERGWERGA